MESAHGIKGIRFNDDDDDDDDDDPIVRTIDVYLSPALSQTLHLLQFPIEPAYASQHNTTPSAARYRPKHNMLELDYTIPSSNNNNAMGAIIGNNDKRNLQKRIHASNSINHVTHSALAKLDATGTRLDVVPLRRSVFQMRPTFHHLHDNEEEEEEEEEEENNEGINSINKDVSDDDDNDLDDHRRPIMFAKKEVDPSTSPAYNNQSSLSRRNSYAHMRAEEASEEWLHLHVVQGSGNNDSVGRGLSSSLVRKELMDKVQCDHVENELRLLPFTVRNDRRVDGGRSGGNYTNGIDNDVDDDDDNDSSAYVKTLNYLDSYSAGRALGEMYVEDLSDWAPSSTMMGPVHDDEEDKHSVDESSLSLGMDTGEGRVAELAIAELASKLAILLQHGSGTMIPYCVLRSRFRRNAVSDSMLLAALSSCAVLVRGNFALKSSLAKFLHASTTRTDTRTMAVGSGVGGSEGQKLHAKSMNDLRDLILLLLNMHGAIQRERLMYVYSNHSLINPDTITFVLNTAAKKTSREESCWVAKVDDDEEFAVTFPEVAACHAMYWLKRKEMLMDYVRLYETAK